MPLFETRKIISALGGSKVMWGTDGPFADYAWEFDKVRKACSSDEQFDQVTGGTIAGLLNL